MKFDLSDGTIPLLTTKKVHTKSIIHELLWMISGSGNEWDLRKTGTTIWQEWADPETGDLGPVYGVLWRKWPSKNGPIDQLGTIIERLKNNPNDRRLLVTAWHPELLPQQKLPPCHYSFQFWVGNGKLSLLVNQRSCDVGLGVPFNIVQYSFLLRMVAHVTGLLPGELTWNGGDVHIYENHIEQLKEQITRIPNPSPHFKFNRSVIDIDDFKYEDFVVENYLSHPAIKLDVAV
jgi:thymidylate synthase